MPDQISTQRRDAIAAFYTSYAGRVRRAVRAHTRNTSDASVEDACAFAWLTLIRRRDITLDQRGVRWLTVVATNQAWALTAARELPAGALRGDAVDADELPEPADDHGDLLELALRRETHRERLAALSALRLDHRRALALHGIGYSYNEIAALTEATYTAVNRYITEGRAKARHALERPEHDAEGRTSSPRA